MEIAKTEFDKQNKSDKEAVLKSFERLDKIKEYKRKKVVKVKKENDNYKEKVKEMNSRKKMAEEKKMESAQQEINKKEEKHNKQLELNIQKKTEKLRSLNDEVLRRNDLVKERHVSFLENEEAKRLAEGERTFQNLKKFEERLQKKEEILMKEKKKTNELNKKRHKKNLEERDILYENEMKKKQDYIFKVIVNRYKSQKKKMEEKSKKKQKKMEHLKRMKERLESEDQKRLDTQKRLIAKMEEMGIRRIQNVEAKRKEIQLFVDEENIKLEKAKENKLNYNKNCYDKIMLVLDKEKEYFGRKTNFELMNAKNVTARYI